MTLHDLSKLSIKSRFTVSFKSVFINQYSCATFTALNLNWLIFINRQLEQRGQVIASMAIVTIKLYNTSGQYKRGRFGKRIYGHSRFCNTDFDDKWACLNLSGI